MPSSTRRYLGVSELGFDQCISRLRAQFDSAPGHHIYRSEIIHLRIVRRVRSSG